MSDHDDAYLQMLDQTQRVLNKLLYVNYRRPRRSLAQHFRYYAPLRRLDEYVCEHPDVPLTLGRAAAIAGLERTYFCRYFRHTTGLTFKVWNDARMMRRAADRLLRCDDAITTIASEFNLDITTFERVFRRVNGTSPSSFRKTFWGN